MDPVLEQSLIKEWVILATSIVFLGWIVYLIASLIRRKLQNVMQKQLLDKFASAQDFAAFLQSPAGQKYVMSFTDAVTNPRNTILSSVRTGFVLAFLGLGFLVASDGYGASFHVGWLGLFLGLGFLVSAAVSHFLARKTGWKEQE